MEKTTLSSPLIPAAEFGLLINWIIPPFVGVAEEAVSNTPNISTSDFKNDSAVALTAEVVSFELDGAAVRYGSGAAIATAGLAMITTTVAAWRQIDQLVNGPC